MHEFIALPAVSMVPSADRGCQPRTRPGPRSAKHCSAFRAVASSLRLRCRTSTPAGVAPRRGTIRSEDCRRSQGQGQRCSAISPGNRSPSRRLIAGLSRRARKGLSEKSLAFAWKDRPVMAAVCSSPGFRPGATFPRTASAGRNEPCDCSPKRPTRMQRRPRARA